MLGNEGAQGARQLVGVGELESLAHVVSNDLRAGVRLECIVRVAALRLILDEVLRLRDLADVVIVRAYTRA